MFLFARVFGLYYYFLCSESVLITKLKAVFLLALVRHKV